MMCLANLRVIAAKVVTAGMCLLAPGLALAQTTGTGSYVPSGNFLPTPVPATTVEAIERTRRSTGGGRYCRSTPPLTAW